MSEYDKVADILFHAAMAVGTSSKNTVIGAVLDACRYLQPHQLWIERKEALNMYGRLFGFIDGGWHMVRGPHGGQWMIKPHMQELLLTLLFAYEYVVQELGAARSPADPSLLQVDLDVKALSLDYS